MSKNQKKAIADCHTMLLHKWWLRSVQNKVNEATALALAERLGETLDNEPDM